MTTIAFSHDGKTLASGVGGNIQLWDIDKGNRQQTIRANNINHFVFADDNNTLISESEISKNENKIQVLNVSTGEQNDVISVKNVSRRNSYTVFGDETVISLHTKSVFTPNGENVAIQTSKGIEIWDLESKKQINTLDMKNSRVGIFALASDGKTIAVGMDPAVRLWDTQTGKNNTFKTSTNLGNRILESIRLHRYRIYALAISPDGKSIAAGGEDKKVLLWKIPEIRPNTILKHDHVVSKLTFSPDGEILASGDTSGKIYLWELKTGQLLTTYNGHGNFISGLTFTPDGKILASISGGYGHLGYNAGSIMLWDVPSN